MESHGFLWPWYLYMCSSPQIIPIQPLGFSKTAQEGIDSLHFDSDYHFIEIDLEFDAKGVNQNSTYDEQVDHIIVNKMKLPEAKMFDDKLITRKSKQQEAFARRISWHDMSMYMS